MFKANALITYSEIKIKIQFLRHLNIQTNFLSFGLGRNGAKNATTRCIKEKKYKNYMS